MPIKKIPLYITYIAIFLIPIFPLIVADSFFFPFITGKAFYFRLLVEIAFSGWIILAFLDARYRPKLTPLAVGVTIFAFIVLLADLLGVNPIRSLWSNFERMEGWLVIIHLWAFFLVTTNLFGSGESGRRIWHRFINVSLLVALVVAGYGLFQLFGWADIHQGSSRIDASLGNAAYMAVYMLINGGFAVYMYFVAKAGKIINDRFLKWAYPIIAILFFFELFETATRGTILGLFGGIMLSLVLYALLARNNSGKSRLYAAGTIALIVIIGLVFWFNRDASFVKSNETLNRLATISLNEVKTQARGYIWPVAVSGAMERPILGWGQENFNYIFNANYNPAMYTQEQWFDRAHSVYLDWLVASGLVGLIAYLALYILLLVVIWKSDLKIGEKSVLTGLVAGYAIHNVFVFDNLASYVLFFTILGFADSFKPGRSFDFLGEEPVGRDTVEYIVVPIVIVIFVGLFYFVQMSPIQANTRLIAAMRSCQSREPDASLFEKSLDVNVYLANQEIREQVLMCANRIISSRQYPGSTNQAYYSLALKEIEAQKTATPKDARIYVLGGSFLNGIGQFNEAEPLLIKAHELSPRKQSIAMELAGNYLNTGNNEEAVALTKETYETTPDYWQYKLAYATTLLIVGRESESKAVFADNPEAFNSPQIAKAYFLRKEYEKAMTVYEAVVKADPTDIESIYQLAQSQFKSGRTSKAVATLSALADKYPEYKTQIESVIKEMQK